MKNDKASNKKKSGKLGGFLLSFMYMLSFMVCGGLIGNCLTYFDDGVIYKALLLLIWFYLAIMLQFAIHEGGHMIFGLLTGYKFVSFRIGSLMLIKIDGKLKLKSYSLAGTGGQCLMSPPEIKDGTYPFKLYNIGGVLNNIIWSAAAVALGIFCFPTYGLGWTFCMIIATLGIGMALANGIPLKTAQINNDGSNAISLGKDKSALFALWKQLRTNEFQLKGVRLKDIPDEYFDMGENADISNPIVTSLEVARSQRILDGGKISEAYEAMEKLLDSDAEVLGLYRNMLVSDMIFCELMGENNPEKLEALYTKEQQKMMKAMKNMPGIVRTEYAYALLHDRDVKKAEKIKKLFERIFKNYPYTADKQSETELMQAAEERSAMDGVNCK